MNMNLKSITVGIITGLMLAGGIGTYTLPGHIQKKIELAHETGKEEGLKIGAKGERIAIANYLDSEAKKYISFFNVHHREDSPELCIFSDLSDLSDKQLINLLIKYSKLVRNSGLLKNNDAQIGVGLEYQARKIRKGNHGLIITMDMPDGYIFSK